MISWNTTDIGGDKDGMWDVRTTECPNCRRLIVHLRRCVNVDNVGDEWIVKESRLVYPRSTAREPLSGDVPADFAKDYLEASAVLTDSAKASAALGRRCLQHLLREKANVKPSDLSEIQGVLDSKFSRRFRRASVMR
jgi:hypothetical protein